MICPDCASGYGFHAPTCPSWGLPPELLAPLRSLSDQLGELRRAAGLAVAQVASRLYAVRSALSAGDSAQALHHLDQALQLLGHAPLQHEAPAGIWVPVGLPLREVLTRYSAAVLAYCRGSKTKAAAVLRVSRRSLHPAPARAHKEGP